ncbi:MAG: ribosome-associated translation inhibitor RaiA [Gammaproteobacteria bacterium]|nr:ribosome-associated translation inhibitor RaiA [Gammaproteobacteria bacterium]MCF6231178.1 ribosome-associated translation inhibitor RaiA [Gammaproteobacteria bacterium]
MQLNITGQKIDLTEAMQEYVKNKIARLERYFDNVTNVHVILSVEKKNQKAEATVHVAGGDLFAESTNENMYAAIDSLVDKLDRQIKKHKEKLTDHHRSEAIAVKSQAVEIDNA